MSKTKKTIAFEDQTLAQSPPKQTQKKINL